MDIDNYFEEELKRNLAYNEKEIIKKTRYWPDRDGRRKALYNICINKNILDYETIRILVIYAAFDNHIKQKFEDFKKKVASFEEASFVKITDLAWFYYNYCKDPKIFKNIDPSLKLIIISSIIESLMSEEKFMDFDIWYRKNSTDTISKDNIQNVWKEYKEEFGATKKFKNFFIEKINDEERRILLKGFSRFDNKKIKIEDVANWLYEMRSSFVHNAIFIPLPEKQVIPCEMCFIGKNKVSLTIKIEVDMILDIFEKGFLRHFGIL